MQRESKVAPIPGPSPVAHIATGEGSVPAPVRLLGTGEGLGWGPLSSPVPPLGTGEGQGAFKGRFPERWVQVLCE
jgi:hypothetical protein